jgi:hypothetical protein
VDEHLRAAEGGGLGLGRPREAGKSGGEDERGGKFRE